MADISCHSYKSFSVLWCLRASNVKSHLLFMYFGLYYAQTTAQPEFHACGFMIFCFVVKDARLRIHKDLYKASPKTWAEAFTNRLTRVLSEAGNFAKGNKPWDRSWWLRERIQTTSRIFLVGVREWFEGVHKMRVGSGVWEGLAKEVVKLQQSLQLQDQCGVWPTVWLPWAC